MHIVEEKSLLSAFIKCAEIVLKNGIRKSDMAEVQDLICEIDLQQPDIDEFKSFVTMLASHKTLIAGHKKALRAYRRQIGNITKPSYIGRLLSYPFLRHGSNDWSPVDQMEVVADQFVEAPQSSNLSMVIFHPLDIRDAFRPGYVPCLSFVDIKFRSGELRTKFYFRSCDFAEVALFDFFHCLELHEKISAKFIAGRPDLKITKQRLLMNFSRAFTYNRRREPLSVIFNEARNLGIQ